MTVSQVMLARISISSGTTPQQSGGGGGWGPPGERDADARGRDVENGFVTGTGNSERNP